MLGALCVDAAEILFMNTLRDTCRMNHIVEMQRLHLFHKVLFRREIHFQKMDTLIGEPLPRTAFAKGHPNIHFTLKCFVHDETANEACSACNQYVVHFGHKINKFLSKKCLLTLFKTAKPAFLTFFLYFCSWIFMQPKAEFVN